MLLKVSCFQKCAFAQRSGAMKAPVGLLSDRTVLRSKMEGPRPDKFRVCERSAAMKAPVGLLSHKAVLRKQEGVASPRQTWGSPDTAPQLCHGGSGFRRSPCRSICFSGATWLDLSNLVARTEYHSRLVLSTLILRFFSQKRCTAGISALFLHSAQRIPLALEENPLVFYCFLKWFLLL